HGRRVADVHDHADAVQRDRAGYVLAGLYQQYGSVIRDHGECGLGVDHECRRRDWDGHSHDAHRISHRGNVLVRRAAVAGAGDHNRTRDEWYVRRDLLKLRDCGTTGRTEQTLTG